MNGIFSRFEYIVAVHYTETREKACRFANEMKRVGIADYDVVWDFQTPYDGVIARSIKLAGSEKYVNVTLGHYRAIKTGFGLGYGHMLIMEDDVRYLSDLDKLTSGIESLPVDYDLAMLDSFNPNNAASCSLLDENRMNEFWCIGADKRTSSASYALSRKGMENLIRMYENPAKGIGSLSCCDQMFQPGLWKGHNFYVAYPNLAVQVETKNTTSYYGLIRELYKTGRINLNDYGQY